MAPPIGEQLVTLHLKTDIALTRLKRIETKLDTVYPKVIENSWWVNKLKLAIVAIAVTGVILGIVASAF